MALRVQAHSPVGPEVGPVKVVVVDVAVRAPDAARVVHFHAHGRPLLLAGLPRRRLGAFAAPRALRVHLELGRLLRDLGRIEIKYLFVISTSSRAEQLDQH